MLKPHRRYVGHHWLRDHPEHLDAMRPADFGASGPANWNWKGGRHRNAINGAWQVWVGPDHYEYEGRLRARRILARVRPDALVVRVRAAGEPVPPNLVVCLLPYQGVLQARARAFDASGHADWERCYACGTYDAPGVMKRRKDGKVAGHRECVCLAAHLAATHQRRPKGEGYRQAALAWVAETAARRERRPSRWERMDAYKRRRTRLRTRSAE